MNQKKKGIGLEAAESGDLEAGWELFRKNVDDHYYLIARKK